jgi:hypothetical protein
LQAVGRDAKEIKDLLAKEHGIMVSVACLARKLRDFSVSFVCRLHIRCDASDALLLLTPVLALFPSQTAVLFMGRCATTPRRS